MLSKAKRGARRDSAPAVARKRAAMSTSPANSVHPFDSSTCLGPSEDADDERTGARLENAQLEKDGGLLSALASVPDFRFADASNRLVNRENDCQAEPATTSPLERTGDSDFKGSRTTSCVLRNEPQICWPPRSNELPPRGLPFVAPAVPGRGFIEPDLRMSTPMLRRPGYALPGMKTFLVTSAIAAALAGSFVRGNSPTRTDVPGLPEPVLHQTRLVAPAPLPQAVPTSIEFGGITADGAERGTQTVSLQPTASLQPAVSLQPTAQSENQPTESKIEVVLPHTVPGSENTKIVGKMATTQEPPSIVRPEPTPIASPELTPVSRSEPTPEPPLINRTPPRSNLDTVHYGQDTEPYFEAGKVVEPNRAGFFFTDSNVRYLTRAELQKLSADQLHIARNEIFARRGRYFKNDMLGAYFSQFSWYQPHAWDVPLRAVEQANIDLIQSIEAAATGPGTVSGPLAVRTKVENGVTFADPSRQHLRHGLSMAHLMTARNEIFARKGRYFKNDVLRAYFSRFHWYQPHAWAVALSPGEQANVKLLQSMEQTAAASSLASRAWRVPAM